MRTALTLITALAGAVLVVTGLSHAWPKDAWDSNVLMGNPGMPFASGLFLIGIMLLFASAVVYNIVKTK